MSGPWSSVAGARWAPLGGDPPDIDEVELGRPDRWDAGRVVAVDPVVDVFSAGVAVAAIERVLAVVRRTPRHAYLLLTTRAKRLLMLGNDGLTFPPNLWIGVVVEDDDDVWRAEDLLRCNTATAWVAAEPLRGPVPSLPVEMLTWVVCRPAPGPVAQGAARDLRDRCLAADVPFRLHGRLDGEEFDGRPAALR